jgi:hypothetical protein
MTMDRKEFGNIAGAKVYLTLEHDPFSSVNDDDGITPKQVQAWKEDRWWYVYAEVTIEHDGNVLGSYGYGSIEYGNFIYTDDKDQVTKEAWISIEDIWDYVGEELKGEAMSQALENVEKFIKWREAVACLESY